MRRHLLATIGLAMAIVGCGAGTAGPPSQSGGVTQPTATAATSESTTPASATAAASSAVVETEDCDTSNVTQLHQAPESEALLPASVADRPLARWSVRGRCWLKVTINRPPADIDALLAEFEAADPARPLDLASLTYAVAGRSDTKADPPYFVFVVSRPSADKEVEVALFLMFGGARFVEPLKAGDLTAYEERTIAGKQVYVGTVEMLRQDEHQRGRPYLYQNDDYMYMVITDDDAWAADAFGQIP